MTASAPVLLASMTPTVTPAETPPATPTATPAMPAGPIARYGGTGGTLPDGMAPIDLYDLPDADLSSVAGIVIGGGCDQLFLERHRAMLDGFVSRGGRLLVNGHVQRIFLTGLTPWRRLDFRGPDDLRPVRLHDHRVWAGTHPDDFWFRTGVPGAHTLEELKRIGVAGFYGRGYHADLPEGSVVVHGIGPLAAPLDYEYPLGDGRVLVHAGNDLLGFADPGRPTRRLGGQLVAWMTDG